jgi:Abortive infection C-terminus
MKELLEQAEALQNLLVAHATGGWQDHAEYVRLRQVLLAQPAVESYVPQFVRTCRNLSQFWELIKYKFGHYHERRTFIWEEFRPLLELLEKGGLFPPDPSVALALEELDTAHVQAIWSRALDRRNSDPEGAITMARTLLESVCKSMLDSLGEAYEDTADLPRLYRATAEALNLAPSQHTEKVFKQILGGCTSVVEGLGSLRNRLGDSHGKGKAGVKPAPRHAELAVNLAGAMATYLVATWKLRTEAAT